MLDFATLHTAAESLAPDSRNRLETYVAEANFFNDVLCTDLKGLSQGSRVIEVGGGIGLLSLQTAAKGFKMASYEPQSSGFSEMLNHREIIQRSWLGSLPDVDWRDTYLTSETIPPETERAAFAFAVNVLEHVPNIESFIATTMKSLLPGGRFRFICPNYAFPYEPHFEIPTLLSKALTFRVFQQRIRTSTIDDPLGHWEELSWPNVWKISRILGRLNLRHSFSHSGTEFYLNRVRQDESFSARKSLMARIIFQFGAATAPTILALTPTAMLPIIDCTIYRDH